MNNMFENREMLSPGIRDAAQKAFRLAWEQGKQYVDSSHILWGLAQGDSTAAKVLLRMGVDDKLIRDILERNTQKNKLQNNEYPQYMFISPDAGKVWRLAEAQAEKLNHKIVEPEHLLLAILQEPDCLAARVLSYADVDSEEMVAEIMEEADRSWPAKAKESKRLTDGKKTDTETLDKYSQDLTELAREGRLDPVIGRDREIQRVVQILSRRTKNNPVLIGEPGVGKTAVAEGLALRIAEGGVPFELAEKRVMALDLTKMLAGTKFRGDFEERIKNAIEEAVESGDVILFIDELHTLIGAGSSEGSMDAANILKPSLGRGEIQVIGATTLDEYRKHIEKDAALERRFQTVMIDEPDQQEAVEILKGLRGRYEEHHKLAISDEAIDAAVKLSSRYIQDRYLPDKAIDLIDEAASRVRINLAPGSKNKKEIEGYIEALEQEKQEAIHYQDFERASVLRDRQNELRKQLDELSDQKTGKTENGVGVEDVASVVSMWTGIPVTMLTEDESKRLLRLEDTLHQRVIGQDEAVKAVSKAIRRSRVGIKDPKRPMGSFLFLGPTGVGKTELCKALAEAMFQDEDAMLRVDMSEFMEQHTVSKLIGSPPGYVGYDEGGQLTEQVRRKPYSVILFDEIEKAHRDVWNILLQIMEDGRLTDAQGRRVDFKNAIVVMTSNVGAKNLTDKRKTLGFNAAADHAGEAMTAQEVREKVMKDVNDTFKPEFLNRIDDIIVFHQLEKSHIKDIAKNMLANLQKRMTELEVQLEVEDTALDLLVEKGFDPKYGARPLRRVIQSEIEDKATELLLEFGLQRGWLLTVSAKDSGFIVRHKMPRKASGRKKKETVEVK